MTQPVYAPGVVVAGKYRIDKAIARGGCSIVYRGTHIDMQRSVALKIMTPDSEGQNDAWTRRFQREAQLASQLRHPNTIITFDHGHDQGLWYIIMEWVEGASLRNAIRDHGPIEPERVATLTAQMLKSLEEAHRHHILHRDLKPSNIMLTHDLDGDEQVKVLDFGLAKVDASELSGELLKLTRDGDFVGTPRYAAPEQLRGLPLSAASDIYGVGMVMWEMLVGAPAVPSIDYAVCVEHHLGPRPWRLPPGAHPPGLAMIVEKALAKDPASRYASCQEMRQALKCWLADNGAPRVADPFSEAKDESQRDQLLNDALHEASSAAEDDDDALPPIELEAPRPRQRAEVRHASPRSTPALGNNVPTGAELKSVSHMNSAELKLDHSRQSYGPTQRLRSPSAPYEHPDDRPSDASRWIAILIGVILLTVVLGVGWLKLRPEHDGLLNTPSSDDELIAELREKEAAKLAKLAPATSNILRGLRQRGWIATELVPNAALGNVHQTALRLSRSEHSVDVTIYECQEIQLAQNLEAQARPPVEAIRFDLTVTWLSPSSGLPGDEAVNEVRRDLVELAP